MRHPVSHITLKHFVDDSNIRNVKSIETAEGIAIKSQYQQKDISSVNTCILELAHRPI